MNIDYSYNFKRDVHWTQMEMETANLRPAEIEQLIAGNGIMDTDKRWKKKRFQM